MTKIKNYYYNLKIKDKLLYSLLMVSILPMFLFLIFFSTRIYDMIVADTIQKQQAASMSVAPKLNTIIDQVVRDCNYIQGSNHFDNILSHDTEESFARFKATNIGKDILDALSANDDQSPTASIRLYTDLPKNHPVYNDEDFSPYIHPIPEITRTYWYGIFQGSHILQLHCPKFYLSDHEIDTYGDTAYITKSYVIYEKEPITVYTAVYYSSDTFMDTLSSTITVPESVAYLINSRNNIVVSTDEALSSTYVFDYETVREVSGSSNNFITKKILGRDVYASFYRLDSPDWFLIVAIPSTPLLRQSRNMMFKITLLYLFVMLIAGILTLNLSRSITRRLSAVSERMLTARTGIPQPVKLTRYHDEIGDLAETYNYMSGQIHQLMDEKLQFVERMRITELNALQAQINPHFLHNTMEMINWLALNGQSEKVTQAVQMLSRFYRLTLSKEGQINTLENEMEHVETYVSLQNMRFDDSVELIMDVPDDLLDYQIPKLTLQPIVENAILHGIMEKENRQGCIVISAWQTGDDTVILISDDGIGMTEEQLANILSGRGESKTGFNIAVVNTHERIRLLYGEKYGLSYSSVYGEGTEVEIHLPLTEELSEDNE